MGTNQSSGDTGESVDDADMERHPWVNDELRTLSSGLLTFIFKYFCPAAWIGGMCLASLSHLDAGDGRSAAIEAAAAAAGLPYMLWAASAVKRVELLDDALLVSDAFKAVHVPFLAGLALHGFPVTPRRIGDNPFRTWLAVRRANEVFCSAAA